jgi:hypothetical protein
MRASTFVIPGQPKAELGTHDWAKQPDPLVFPLRRPVVGSGFSAPPSPGMTQVLHPLSQITQSWVPGSPCGRPGTTAAPNTHRE